MYEIIEKYCKVKNDFGSCVLFEYNQGFEFMYINENCVEFRMGFSAMIYHVYTEKEKLQMLFNSFA